MAKSTICEIGKKDSTIARDHVKVHLVRLAGWETMVVAAGKLFEEAMVSKVKLARGRFLNNVLVIVLAIVNHGDQGEPGNSSLIPQPTSSSWGTHQGKSSI